MKIKIRQMKIKNPPDYLFSDNLIVDIKDFDSNLSEINKLSFKGVFSVSIHNIKSIPKTSPNLVNIDRTDNEKDHLYLVFDDVEGYIEQNDGIEHLVFASTDKNKEALKNYKIFGKKLKSKLK